jgi:hypothetical protein
MAAQIDLLHNLDHATLAGEPNLVPVTTPAIAVPQPLQAGERVELWLALPPAPADALDAPTAARRAATGADAAPESAATAPESEDWDVRLARVAGTGSGFIAVFTGNWQLAGAPGMHGIVRRLGAAGIAEWSGIVVSPTAIQDSDLAALGVTESAGSSYEAAVLLQLAPDALEGVLYQRRRSPRLPLRLTPVRLQPLAGADPALAPSASAPASPTWPAAEPAPAIPEDDDPSLLPVARLMDVSAHGAAVVVDTPLSTGTTVALEFELPGESEPFAVRGRVVEPAVALHGDVQPQLDGLPGFRRGIEFVGSATSRQTSRLAATLTRLLQRRPS